MAVPSSRRIILSVEDPYSNHNGGHVAFGRDGFLYTTIGDGGAGGDPENRAQDPDSLFGKLLRYDVNRTPAQPEIVAAGLRNAWRFTFDRANGDLYIGDVGQNAVEEIDYTRYPSPGLENYEWDVREGSSTFEDKPYGPGRRVGPVAEYDHDEGCSVTGGYVYRGKAVRRQWAATSTATTTPDGSGASSSATVARPGSAPSQATPRGALVVRRGCRRRLYLVSHNGTIYRSLAASNGRAGAHCAVRPPTNLRPVAECRVRDRAERLVARAQLAADMEEPLLGLEAVVDPLELLDDPVEPLEQGVDLSVAEVTPLHGPILRAPEVRAGGRRCGPGVRWRARPRPGHGRVLTEGGSQPFEGVRAGLDALEPPRRSELGQRQIGQLRGRVGERAEADAAAGQLPQRRARRCIGSEVDRARSSAKRPSRARQFPAPASSRAFAASPRSAGSARVSTEARVRRRARHPRAAACRPGRRRGRSGAKPSREAARRVPPECDPGEPPRRRSRRPAAPRAGPARRAGAARR